MTRTAMGEAEIRHWLEGFPHWHYQDGALTRVIEPPTYRAALDLVNRVGHLAEELNHHPDIFMHYKKVTLRFWTHTARGVTEYDLKAATEVERLLGQL